jgi:hypothetical protein
MEQGNVPKTVRPPAAYVYFKADDSSRICIESLFAHYDCLLTWRCIFFAGRPLSSLPPHFIIFDVEMKELAALCDCVPALGIISS